MQNLTFGPTLGPKVKYPRMAQAGCPKRTFTSRPEPGLEVKYPHTAQAGCPIREFTLTSKSDAQGEISPYGTGRVPEADLHLEARA